MPVPLPLRPLPLFPTPNLTRAARPSLRYRRKAYAPICSFYCGAPDRFADLPIPTSEDWEAATGEVYPPTFFHEKDNGSGGSVKMNSDPRDLFTEANFRKFARPWEDKTATAFFRGTATGGGTTALNNQRIGIASLSHEWKTASFPSPHAARSAAGEPPFLDAAITGWNKRDKKIAGSPMTHVKEDEFEFKGGKQNYIPIYEQSAYKYLVYVDGHCAACRYGFMMRLGSVILKVESRTVADR